MCQNNFGVSQFSLAFHFFFFSFYSTFFSQLSPREIDRKVKNVFGWLSDDLIFCRFPKYFEFVNLTISTFIYVFLLLSQFGQIYDLAGAYLKIFCSYNYLIFHYKKCSNQCHPCMYANVDWIRKWRNRWIGISAKYCLGKIQIRNFRNFLYRLTQPLGKIEKKNWTFRHFLI